jgi:hypothetical protein
MDDTNRSFDTFVNNIKAISLPGIDLTDKTMRRIYESSSRTRKVRLRTKHSKKIGAAAIMLFVMMSLSVSAAVVPLNWFGLEVSIQDDGGANARIDAFKELIFGPQPSYKQTIEEVFQHPEGKLQQVFTLEEALPLFPYPLLRPHTTKDKPYRSIGGLMNHRLQVKGEPERIIGSSPVFHDFYGDDKKWIIVSQRLDENATSYLKGEINSNTSTYVGAWEQVQINDRVMAVYVGGKKQNRLDIKYNNGNEQVIDLDVQGNVSKEELLRLAKAYVVEGNP